MSLSDPSWEIVNGKDLQIGDELIGKFFPWGIDKFSVPWIVKSLPTLTTLFTEPRWRISMRNSESGSLFPSFSYTLDQQFVRKLKELKYDPMQQGDTDEDI